VKEKKESLKRKKKSDSSKQRLSDTVTEINQNLLDELKREHNEKIDRIDKLINILKKRLII